MITGALFDVDGTLVDTTYVHTLCWAQALGQHGYVVPMAVVHRAIGMGSDELLDHVLGSDRDKDADQAIIDAHLTLYKLFWGDLRPLPGAAELLHACARRSLRVVLASSASRSELDTLRGVLDADAAIDAATSSSDADAGKPAPDIVAAALERSGLAAHEAVFVGDSVWDGQAAGRAGVQFVGLTCGGTSAAELREAGAVDVYADPADLSTKLDDLLKKLGPR